MDKDWEGIDENRISMWGVSKNQDIDSGSNEEEDEEEEKPEADPIDPFGYIDGFPKGPLSSPKWDEDGEDNAASKIRKELQSESPVSTGLSMDDWEEIHSATIEFQEGKKNLEVSAENDLKFTINQNGRCRMQPNPITDDQEWDACCEECSDDIPSPIEGDEDEFFCSPQCMNEYYND